MDNQADGQYARGVDSRKGGYGKIFTAVEPAVFPHAFCKIYIDPDFGFAFSKHSDGVGSKSAQRYIHAMETGDYSVFEGDADDGFVMNAADVACAGLLDAMVFTDMVDINQLYVDKKRYLAALNAGFERIKKVYAAHGILVLFAGGETADLVDQTKTVIFNGDIYARANDPRKVVTCERIAPGDVIFGFRSGGDCALEANLNSGLMSNGLTGGRHDLMHADYGKKYPETIDLRGDPYKGRFRIGDVPTGLGMEVSEALMSPTRHFPLIVKRLLEACGDEIHGIVMNTGGGQTKCTRVGKGLQYIKMALPEPDPIFMLIHEESGRSWRNMYQGFNCGIGLDVMARPEMTKTILGVAHEFDVGCTPLGECQASKDGKNHLHVDSVFGQFDYDEE